jgi:hypothetical protein
VKDGDILFLLIFFYFFHPVAEVQFFPKIEFFKSKTLLLKLELQSIKRNLEFLHLEWQAVAKGLRSKHTMNMMIFFWDVSLCSLVEID